MFGNLLSMLQNAKDVYEHFCRPVCKEYSIQQTGLDILIYISKNPQNSTAVDIQKCGGLKQSLVSFHVDKLVNDGYIERQAIEGDRRKIRLVYTEKAQPVIEAGLAARQKYLENICNGISEDEAQAFSALIENIKKISPTAVSESKTVSYNNRKKVNICIL